MPRYRMTVRSLFKRSRLALALAKTGLPEGRG